MSNIRPTPPGRVPTLTEVVQLPGPTAAVAPVSSDEANVDEPSFARTIPAGLVERRAGPAAAQEDEIVQRVLADLQRQIDLMLEVRMREVLAPVLTRATDALMREARTELASTLRDVVARAVAQELSRHRGR